MSNCPLCKKQDKRDCKVVEQPNGRLACECGKHQWPNSAVYAETLRRSNLTVVKAVHDWTQSL